MLDYYEMVEALKRDKFLSELPEEQVVAADLEITDFPCDHPDPKATSLIREVSIQTPTDLKVRIQGITAADLITNWMLTVVTNDIKRWLSPSSPTMKGWWRWQSGCRQASLTCVLTFTT